MYCHVGTLFQFNVYSYPSLIKLLFIMCTSCFTWDAWNSDDDTTTLVEVTRSPFSRLLAYGDFVSGFGAFRLPHAIGHARGWEPAVSFGTKLRPIVSFHRSLRSPLKTFSHADLHLILFTTFSLIKVFLRARKEIIEFEKVSDVKEVEVWGGGVNARHSHQKDIRKWVTSDGFLSVNVNCNY